MDISLVTFPSPVETPHPANNTVHCEYFRPLAAGRRKELRPEDLEKDFRCGRKRTLGQAQDPDTPRYRRPQRFHDDWIFIRRRKGRSRHDRNAEAARDKIEQRAELVGDDAVIENDAALVGKDVDRASQPGIGRHGDHRLVRDIPEIQRG